MCRLLFLKSVRFKDVSLSLAFWILNKDTSDEKFSHCPISLGQELVLGICNFNEIILLDASV